ncbi:hypothetical protein GCM10027160_34120 [Streptomyces calidiresistens]|uniref:Uncharacterized protein n=1 Tax=Streptomyces calidiresistens TaxID=1485586 RepID=A0A7W3T031_9ACTN|nr:hypothetical protein [Streptomyces calidiresistens]MBB0228358.1 hypothetical protein [Streptomyces calidiresistens]
MRNDAPTRRLTPQQRRRREDLADAAAGLADTPPPLPVPGARPVRALVRCAACSTLTQEGRQVGESDEDTPVWHCPLCADGNR